MTGEMIVHNSLYIDDTVEVKGGLHGPYLVRKDPNSAEPLTIAERLARLEQKASENREDDQ